MQFMKKKHQDPMLGGNHINSVGEIDREREREGWVPFGCEAGSSRSRRIRTKKPRDEQTYASFIERLVGVYKGQNRKM